MAYPHRIDPFGITSAAVVLVDARGLIHYWNRRAQTLLGHPAAHVLGRPVTSVLAGEDALASFIAGRRRVGDGWEGVITARHRAGHRVDLAVRTCPLSNGHGARWLAVACEVTALRGWELDQALVRGLLEESALGVGVLDTDLRFHRINRVLAGMEGLLPAGRPGPETAGPHPVPPTVEAQARQVLMSGRVPLAVEQVAAPRGDQEDAERGHLRLRSSFPLRDPDGKMLGVCHTAAAFTVEDRARERLTLVNEAGQRIGTSLDLHRTVHELGEVLVPQLADFAAVDLFEGVLTAKELTARQLTGDTLQRAAHLSIHQDLPEAVVALGEPAAYPAQSPQRRCLTTGRTVRDPVLDPSTWWLSGDSQRRTRLETLGVHSHLTVPLRARGVTMGVVTLLRWENQQAFDEDDQLLVEELVARAAVCVDNARRFAREHDAALALQTSLLPPDVPEHTAVDVAFRYLPTDAEAGVGGDWFDVIPLSGARVALVVGDVIGHGIHAAASMGRLRAAVQTLADLDLPPDELLAHVDDLVLRLAEEAEAAPGGPKVIGATCVYAVYDPISRRLQVARAGHPSPAIAHLTQPVEYPDIPAGPPLGLGGLPFESAELEVEEGSVIALYTDGLIEASDRDVDVGFERLSFALAHPDRPLEEICDTMVRILLPDHPPDDVAFLVARTRALSPDLVATWEVPPDPAAVQEARGNTARKVAEWGLDDCAFTAELVVSELVTNAITHACGPITLRLINERHLICEVSDGGSTSPHLRRAQATDEGGRGLFLVAQVAQRWGTRYTPTGKTIWAELQLPPPAGRATA
ncbi:ATP-binding SpoIIE family protein phosphatase [Streptomyces tropicalis]|uniref:SpoIIE family protein phosphatase n=1 Tax=Streptomyces tropicalis TaxID=3034234 RepID=A0ABT6A3G9_9ACTN|nr:SpoIIE family protein phosphatase [Streptomyces tropicalis]MDF3299189.1 SpoIIE family protein phosphatase [Streptomyces tropicalis]